MCRGPSLPSHFHGEPKRREPRKDPVRGRQTGATYLRFRRKFIGHSLATFTCYLSLNQSESKASHETHELRTKESGRVSRDE